MNRVLLSTFCMTFIAHISVYCQNCDSLGILIYEDLGCKVVKKDDKGCPKKYQCDNYTHKKDSCLFRGMTYGLGDQIDNNLTYASCNVGCFCENSTGKTKFVCAVLDCPEWLGSPIQPGCYRKFEIDGCCSVGMICPSSGEKIAECNIDREKFMEGQKIFPKKTCSKCICGKGWNGHLETPFCKRFGCNTQINSAEELSNGCAPVYFNKETLCCPDSWVCPSSSDEITKVNNDVESNSELTCTFGTKTVQLGEGLKKSVNHFGSERNVQCECIIPPFLTCKEV